MKTTPTNEAAKNFYSPISVYTEMPDNAVENATHARVFYDADCAFCTGLLDHFGNIFEQRGFVFESLQKVIADREFDIPAEEFDREMKLLRADGCWLGGADAWIELFNRVWYLRPIGFIATLPPFHTLAHAIYQRIAANRHCMNGACKVGQASSLSPGDRTTSEKIKLFRVNRSAQATAKPQPTGWKPVLLWQTITFAPLVVLPVVTIFPKPILEPWLFMWALAVAIFVGCKWMTLFGAIRRGTPYTFRTALVYLFGWTGMNAATFPIPATQKNIDQKELGFAFTKTLIGSLVLWWIIPALPTAPPLGIGWLGMIGVILMLHFGLFHLLSIALRRSGFNAPVMMKAPMKARTVSEFWGVRWNQPFHELTTQYLFQPARRFVGPKGALLVCFLASGLIHDLVITFPAGGGYGLPTVYFLIQGIGLLMEKYFFKNPKLAATRRLFTWIIVVGPVGLLFPPIFVERIILPMLHAIGAN